MFSLISWGSTIYEVSWYRHASLLWHFALLCCFVRVLAVLGLPGVHGLSQDTACRFLIVVASLVVGSEVVARGLICPEVCGIFLDRIKLMSPTLAGLTTGIPNHWTTREALIVFHQLKALGNPAPSKSIGVIFPTAFAHFMPLCHIWQFLQCFEFLSYYWMSFGDLCNQWSLMFLL